ncbi:MAG: glutathione S-transferase family protein [Synechococcales bacterium]|nr:glutathione S-transferase family protein [Synechococcales bacterium]
MLKLYGAQRSRATLVQWYLQELGVPYEDVVLDLQAGEQRQPPFLAINPFGKVPALEDGDLKLWESGAILFYLADAYAQPEATAAQRAVWAQWVLFANATLGPGLFVEANREREAPRLLGALDSLLASQSFIAGDEFSVADVAVGSYLVYATMMVKQDYTDYPAIASYLTCITGRPAFQNTMGVRVAS